MRKKKKKQQTKADLLPFEKKTQEIKAQDKKIIC